MKELLRGESTISLEAAVLKCPNAELLPQISISLSICADEQNGKCMGDVSSIACALN
jgi:hypothetical protein